MRSLSAPGTDWKEQVADDEDARFEGLATKLREIQRRRAAKNGGISRGLHAKAQAGVVGQLVVPPDLPEVVRVGIFAGAGTFPAYVRFSNGGGTREHDGKPDVRGVAIKLLRVPGKKLIPGLEDARTQDLLLLRNASVPFRTPEEFIALVAAAERPALLLPRLIGAIGLRRTFAILPTMAKALGAPISSLATTTWFSPLPMRWGAHAAKISLAAHATDGGAPIGRGASRDALGEELAERLRRGAQSWDLRVQLFVDEARTPIENPTIAWPEAEAPWVTVGRLELPRQDVSSARGQKIAERIEALSFDPWHAPVEFRPLGAMMRARNHAYRLSTMERHAAAEPDESELPGD